MYSYLDTERPKLIDITKISIVTRDKFKDFEKRFSPFVGEEANSAAFNVKRNIGTEIESYCNTKFAFGRFRTSCET